WSSSIGPASRSDDTPRATVSSTSTTTQPEPPRQQPTQLRTRQLRRAHSPAACPETNSEDAHRRPEHVSGTHKVGTLQSVGITIAHDRAVPTPRASRHGAATVVGEPFG